jgi:hypothetical protein
MTTPRYVTRFARVARAIPILALHPAGRRLSELARQLGTSATDLRAEIKAYCVADPPHDLVGAHWEPVIEFASGPGAEREEEDLDFGTAAFVRLRDMRFGPNVGVKFLSIGELAVASHSGHAVLAREPAKRTRGSQLSAVMSNFPPPSVSVPSWRRRPPPPSGAADPTSNAPPWSAATSVSPGPPR